MRSARSMNLKDNMYSSNRTIAAVSTPHGKGGIAVIRISGEDTMDILTKVFRPASGKDISSYPERYSVYGNIISNGKRIDSGIAVFFRGPGSFTGEDTAEISCHGGIYVTNEVLTAVLTAGAVLAGPGEFTKRAFLSGKLSLSEAEATGELIDADTHDKMMLFSSAVSGNISSSVSSISDELNDAMSLLYATIDYPEEGLMEADRSDIIRGIREAKAKIDRLLDSSVYGRAISEGAKCVICGKPNAGKSTLFNLMANENRAIVTDIAGTTRDVLHERVSFAGITLELYDTAGLRQTDDVVEKIGVESARKEISSADIIIDVIDSSHMDKFVPEDIEGASVRIAMVNKCDTSTGDIPVPEHITSSHDYVISSSLINKKGLSELEDVIRKIYGSDRYTVGKDTIIWSARQKAQLGSSSEKLSAVLHSLESGAPDDVICTQFEDAVRSLNDTDPSNVNEEMINLIFSKFCIGK